MATSKKKKSAKRAVKKTVKATRKAASASQAAWKQQSAKLYQLPQSAEGVSEVTKQAAAAAQSATESMMRMGSDAMQQWWSLASQSATSPEAVAAQAKSQVADMFRNVPGFDAAGAQARFMDFGRAGAEQFNHSASSYARTLNEALSLSRENAEAVMEVCNTGVSLSKELSAEFISFCNKSFSQNVELSKQVLACRTLNDMFDLGSRFMKTNLDSFFSESVKLSELVFQASTDVSEPLNARFTDSSDRLSKALAA